MMFYNTISNHLHEALKVIMQASEFAEFRLVGGTALSLQLGHRISVDIDLFTDRNYGDISFKAIDHWLEKKFVYHSSLSPLAPALGKSYSVGSNEENAVKLDVYYTDRFIQPALIIDEIRLATVEEIVAMKMDIIQRGGRKKDFWDLHELMNNYSIGDMLALHKERYPYNHEEDIILDNFTRFEMADEDFNPICLRGKHWEFIKEDTRDWLNTHRK